MTVQVAVMADLMRDGVQIAIRRKGTVTLWAAGVDDVTRLLRWEQAPSPEAAAFATPLPSLILDDDVARALLDQLTRHFQGASDVATLRADFLHERGRADKLLDALIRDGAAASMLISERSAVDLARAQRRPSRP